LKDRLEKNMMLLTNQKGLMLKIMLVFFESLIEFIVEVGFREGRQNVIIHEEVRENLHHLMEKFLLIVRGM
jgi:hypothetical protein